MELIAERAKAATSGRKRLLLYCLLFITGTIITTLLFSRTILPLLSLNPKLASVETHVETPGKSNMAGAEDETFRVVFQTIEPLMELARSNKLKQDSRRKHLAAAIQARLPPFSSPLPRRSLAKALLITADEAAWLWEVLRLRDDHADQPWFNANVDQANHYIKVLIGEQNTTYPDVDSPSFKDRALYDKILLEQVQKWCGANAVDPITGRFGLVIALHYANDQGRLIRNLYLQDIANKPALHARNWSGSSHQPYAAVVVVGHSPTKKEWNSKLSQKSMDKLDRSITQNRNHNLAPLYIMCGGSVRPQLTQVVESYELKRLAMQKYAVSEQEIIIDATSEHTYSNWANAALLAKQLGWGRDTKMIAFLPQDQYEFCLDKGRKGIMKKAHREVFPDLDSIVSIEDGPYERSIVLTMLDFDFSKHSRIMLWRDYTGNMTDS